jgi:putative ABC transport system permease protein
MNENISTLTLTQLALAFIPALAVLLILLRWSLGAGTAIYALARMLGQLLLIGYFLSYLFAAEHASVIVVVLAVMVLASSWIALRTSAEHRRHLYLRALVAVGLGGGFVLLMVTRVVLNLDPWYLPQYIIPLAGMIFATAMNSVSLAADRMLAEQARGLGYHEARAIAMQAAMIPNINSLFAVGLVSLPGMMTGQILSGVSPLIAVRYQIMVMCMLFAAAGLAAALFLALLPRRQPPAPAR